MVVEGTRLEKVKEFSYLGNRMQRNGKTGSTREGKGIKSTCDNGTSVGDREEKIRE